MHVRYGKPAERLPAGYPAAAGAAAPPPRHWSRSSRRMQPVTSCSRSAPSCCWCSGAARVRSRPGPAARKRRDRRAGRASAGQAGAVTAGAGGGGRPGRHTSRAGWPAWRPAGARCSRACSGRSPAPWPSRNRRRIAEDIVPARSRSRPDPDHGREVLCGARSPVRDERSVKPRAT